MTVFNLAVALVVDDDGRMLGQITVDDVLNCCSPLAGGRQYGWPRPNSRRPGQNRTPGVVARG